MIWDNNKVINVIPATNGVKHNGREKLTYEFHFLLKIWFWEKGDSRNVIEVIRPISKFLFF